MAATYTCDKCGMSVNMSCATCGDELVHDTITNSAGTQVAVSKCPQGHGMIKSPQCCGQDMTCSV
jgi:NMD protein affecting ribosome stability and mRNA decay